MIELNRIYCMDALQYLLQCEDNSVHCIITSPPYYGLRDYQTDGQIGLRDTLDGYLDTMTLIFREARRVLRDDGVLWLNMGDSYARQAGDDSKKETDSGMKTGRTGHSKDLFKSGNNTPPPGLKPKDLMGVPWRLAFRLQDDGWYLRQDIVWHKPNPMPESVRDRCTKAHEYVFLMAKSARYWYDADAIRGPMIKGDANGGAKNYRVGTMGRNKRSVWTVSTEAFPDAHFATFPTKLITPMVLAGCPHKTCAVCGAGWERVVDYKSNYTQREAAHTPNNCKTKVDSTGWEPPTIKYNGWRPTCTCNAETRPGVVLDMFMGSGTTALVARQNGRDYLGCDISPEYVEMAQDRLAVPYTPIFNEFL